MTPPASSTKKVENGSMPGNLGVTRLGLGTAPLGNLFRTVTDREAAETIETALGAGWRFFDTAPLYGSGAAETRLGNALAGISDKRTLTVATKVGRLLSADAPPDPSQVVNGEPLYVDTGGLNPVPDFSKDGVLRSLDESRRRLGVDHINIVHIHDPDRHMRSALDDAYPVLHALREQGVIDAVSVGAYSVSALTTFVENTDLDCVMVAGRLTLMDNTASHDLLPACRARNVRVLAAGVFNSGILSGSSSSTTFDYRPASTQELARVDRLRAICSNHHIPLGAAAMQYPLRYPEVVSVVVGARTAAEVIEDNFLAGVDIPDDAWAELDGALTAVVR